MAVSIQSTSSGGRAAAPGLVRGGVCNPHEVMESETWSWKHVLRSMWSGVGVLGRNGSGEIVPDLARAGGARAVAQGDRAKWQAAHRPWLGFDGF